MFLEFSAKMFLLRLLYLMFPVLEVMGDRNMGFNLKFQQHDYKVDFEWGEAVRYNKHYLRKFDLRTFKYNRTCTAFNLTTDYTIDVGNDLELVHQAYKFASNEYREFPMRFQINYCMALAKNIIGARRVFQCGNFTECPLVKRKNYHVCNFTPDPAEFPPYIPSGRYKIQVQGFYRNVEMFVVNAYGRVYRPFV